MQRTCFLTLSERSWTFPAAEDRETRRKVIGLIEGRLFTVVYTVRTGSIRIISARRSNMMETQSIWPVSLLTQIIHPV